LSAGKRDRICFLSSITLSHHLPGFHPSFLKVSSIILQAGENGKLFEWNSRCDYHPHHVQDYPI
jgi:hypothetical protein